MSTAGDDRSAERERMIDEIAAIAAEVATESGRPALSPRVLGVMRRVPRHAFVPAAEAASAYRNRPLPIGYGQTISQPFIVALMTDLLDVTPDHRILEIGTGSGYQAAVLSELAGEVYSIEIVAPLARSAAETLAALGAANVHVRAGDGYAGWPEAAPFDRIILTAAPDHVPPALVAQLKAGGRMVLPVGGESQDLMVIEKMDDGSTISRTVLPVRFVPMVRENGGRD